MVAVLPLAKEPGGLEGVRQKVRPHCSSHTTLSRQDLFPSFLPPTQPLRLGESITWQLGTQALEVDLLGSNPDLVALPVSTFSLSEPWFFRLHFGIIVCVL